MAFDRLSDGSVVIARLEKTLNGNKERVRFSHIIEPYVWAELVEFVSAHEKFNNEVTAGIVNDRRVHQARCFHDGKRHALEVAKQMKLREKDRSPWVLHDGKWHLIHDIDAHNTHTFCELPIGPLHREYADDTRVQNDGASASSSVRCKICFKASLFITM